jgi:hypothetical protein
MSESQSIVMTAVGKTTTSPIYTYRVIVGNGI